MVSRCFCLSLVVLILPAFQSLSAEPLFPNSSYTPGELTQALALGDFNEDGSQDMVTTEARFVGEGILGGVVVRLGRGDGTFGEEHRFPCGSAFPSAMAAGDVSGDFHIDLVVVDDFNHKVIILYGRGDGTFHDPFVRTFGQSPNSVDLFDLNADGTLDIVVYDQPTYSAYQVVIEYSPFGLQLSVPLPYQANAVAAGDFNGDSLPDLAVSPIGIYLQTSPDVFQFVGVPSGLNGASGVSTGDFDEDGLLDLAVTRYTPGSLDILHGRGDGTFSPGISLPSGVGLAPGHPTVDDYDRDGHLDVLVVDQGSPSRPGHLDYFHGRGDGTFDPTLMLGRGLYPLDVAVADLNGDQNIDLAVFGIGVVIVLGNRSGGFTTEVSLGSDTLFEKYWSSATADFDADGNMDLAVGEDFAVNVHRGKGDGTFHPSQSVTVSWEASSIGVGDLNGDGKLDMAVTQSSNFGCLAVAILLGNGDGTFTAGTEAPAGCQPISVGLGDFNRDRKLDVAVVDRNAAYSSILLGRGDGSFDPPILLTMGVQTTYVAVGDFDRDGDDDVAFTHRTYPNVVSVFLSRGDGTFDSETSFPAGYDSSESVIARDLNGDGNLDLAVANYSSIDISILLGRGDGTFAPAQPFTVGQHLQFLTAGDFDADGSEDLAVTQYSGSLVWVLLGGGDGTFAVSEQLSALGKQGIASADFNGDGRIDLGIAAFPGAAVLLSQPPPDTDGDGVPDDVDPCTDLDGDGFGDPGFENNICALDNCPSLANPGQEDADGDFQGDSCDPCPADFYDDLDGDGLCNSDDNCYFVYNPGQEPEPDQDGDGILDECDNCPSVANPDQADRKHPDGWGDACQPFISILDIRQDGGAELEVTVETGDPQGETLSGRMAFQSRDNIVLQSPASGERSCTMDAFPQGRPGVGLGYIVENGHSVLFDIDSRLGCDDETQDFEVARGLQQGQCSDSQTVFMPSIDLTELGPNLPLLCVRRVGHPESEMELVYFADETSFHAQYFSLLLIPPFGEGLPPRTDISALTPGLVYLLDILVTDGNTGEAYDSHSFLYQGEATMVLQSPSGPEARISAETEVECDGPRSGTVALDGSASTPGEGGTLVSYEWFVDFGEADQQMLGTGAILNATLQLGVSVVTLRVSDDLGQTATAEVSITVRDTTPPLFALKLDRSTLWPPNHSMVDVHAVWTVLDVCDPSPAVSLVSVTSSEPEDAPGGTDGNTSGDVSGAYASSADDVFALRAERSGAGPGRTYEILYRAADASGNTSPALAIVTVPHDLGSGPDPLHLRVEDPGSPDAAEVYWNAVGGALAYDLISGDLGSVRISAGRTSLGSVLALARSTTELSWSAGSSGRVPAVGHALFYLVQYRNEQGGTGFGTESAPWPREPDAYEGESTGQPAPKEAGTSRVLVSDESGSP